MKKRNWFIGSLLAAVLMLSACGQADDNQTAIIDESTPIEVELLVPETAELDEVVVFESVVTQGDDLVEDASEVVYEVWLEGQKEQSEMIEADEQDGHVYRLSHTFDEAGRYHVQTHVTARGLHMMPTKQIDVGEFEHDEAVIEEEEAGAHAH